MTLAEELAQRIHSVTSEALSAEVVHAAKIAILDTVGVTLAGAVEDCTRIVDRVTTGQADHGQSLIYGTRRRAAPLDAALINGTAAHALDFDCSSITMGGHPTVHIVPALFALAEAHQLSGRDLLTAFVAGHEVQARLGDGVQPIHFLKGWFPTSTIGMFGATAAAAHLLRLSKAQIAQALGLSVMFASGVMAGSGSMAKPVGAGHAARSGLMAALLVRDGFTGSLEAMEDRRGFLTLFNGAGQFSIEKMFERWARPFDVVDPGFAFKQYPCCGINHSAIDVLLDMKNNRQLKADDIEAMKVYLHPHRIGHVNRPDPRTEIAAKFSATYCLAVTLLRGAPQSNDFEGDKFLDPIARHLMSRIEVLPDLTSNPDAPLGDQFGVRVEIALKGGGQLAGAMAFPISRDPRRPGADQLFAAKFLDCASLCLSSSGAASVLDLLQRLETVANVADIAKAMLAHTKEGQSAVQVSAAS